MIRLPEEFEKRMKEMLKDEYEAFKLSYEEMPVTGLRVNTLKIDPEKFTKIFPYGLKKIKWCDTGFEVRTDEKYGRLALHDAGAFYMQEPFAQAVAYALESVMPLKGLKVLDLCAAPGGKSTQIASYMQGEGLLVSNEINKDRAGILSSNIERMGVKNCVVTNETPDRIAEVFDGFFDVIVIDAPCSGEGMFRKDENAKKEWSLSNVKMCAKRQKSILSEAVKALKDDGIMVYSTCTFSPEEDEGVIADFLAKNPDFDTIEADIFKDFEKGRADLIKKDEADGCAVSVSKETALKIKRSARLFPHKNNGEGHFICILKRMNGDKPAEELKEKNPSKGKKKRKIDKRIDRRSLEIFDDFCNDNLSGIVIDKEKINIFRDSLWAVPDMFENKEGELRILREGLWLGDIKKDRFEPSHSFAMALKKEEAKISADLSKEDAVKYRHGEEIRLDVKNGWILICVDGVSLGWGKAVNGTIKNHYPKGLRIKY